MIIKMVNAHQNCFSHEVFEFMLEISFFPPVFQAFFLAGHNSILCHCHTCQRIMSTRMSVWKVNMHQLLVFFCSGSEQMHVDHHFSFCLAMMLLCLEEQCGCCLLDDMNA